MSVKKILFIGLSSVGDVVMTTPVMQSLHNLFPEARFDIVTDKRAHGLYEHCPYLNKLYIKDKNRPLRGVPDLLLDLWKNYYDVIVDLRTDGLAYLLRGKKRYTKWTAKSYGSHAVEDLMGVISTLHTDKPIPDTQVWLSRKDRDYAQEMVKAFSDKNRLLAFSVGDPNKPIKTSSVEGFISLLKLHEKDFSGIIFLGGKTENDNTLKVAATLDTPYINVTGNSLMEAASLIECARLYIGPDSGLGHIAAAVKTPTISLFSQAAPERFRPWGKAICIRGRDDDARNISVDEISQAITGFLNE